MYLSAFLNSLSACMYILWFAASVAIHGFIHTVLEQNGLTVGDPKVERGVIGI